MCGGCLSVVAQRTVIAAWALVSFHHRQALVVITSAAPSTSPGRCPEACPRSRRPATPTAPPWPPSPWSAAYQTCQGSHHEETVCMRVRVHVRAKVRGLAESARSCRSASTFDTHESQYHALPPGAIGGGFTRARRSPPGRSSGSTAREKECTHSESTHGCQCKDTVGHWLA